MPRGSTRLNGRRRPLNVERVRFCSRVSDRDGTKAGFDVALTRSVARAVSIPVIASGGVGELEHFAEGVIDGEADAVLAASVFHFGQFSIRQVKEYMASQGIPVRLDF